MLVILLLCCSVVPAQRPNYLRLGFDEGLASNSVYRMAQIHEGYMCYATASGLSLFDGSRFRNLAYEDGLTSNDVLNLYCDSQGRLWLLPYMKTVCYLKDGRMHNPTTDPWLGTCVARNFFTSVIEDREHNIWLGDDKGIYYRLDTCDAITPMYEMAGNEVRNFAGLFLDANGDPMAVTNSALHDLSRGIVVDSLTVISNKWDAPFVVEIGRDSFLAVLGQDFIFVHGGKMERLQPPWPDWNAKIMHAGADRSGGIWLSTSDGAYRLGGLRVEAGKVTFRDSLHLFPDKAITSAFEDHAGSIWLSTVSDGIYLLPSISSITYPGGPQEGTSFANKVFLDSKGRVWTGFDGSIIGVLKDGQWERIDFPTPSQSRGRTNDIFEDGEGNVFVLMDAGMLITTGSGQRIEVVKGGKALVQDRTGAYYISHSWTVDTLPSVRPEGFEAAFRLRLGSNSDDLLQKRCPTLAMDANGDLCLGTLEGLYRRRNGKIDLVEAVPKLPISKVALAPDGRLWIATTVDGAGYLEGDRFYPVTRQHGLPSNVCNDIGFGLDGAVWVATNGGLSRVVVAGPGSAPRIENYSRGAGLASDEVRSVALDREHVYAATAKGLTVMDLHSLTASPPKVIVRIEEFAVNGNPIVDLSRMGPISYSDNQISVQFTGISFRYADKLRMEFLLDSDAHNGQWTQTQSRRLEFPDMRPGRYHLSIRATVDGIPASMGVTHLEFEILPAFWQTRWFFILVVVAVIAVVSLIFWLSMRRLRLQAQRRAEIDRRIAETEQKALRAQMNPHFIFNSLNSIEQFFLSNRPQEANAFIADFSDLMRTILEYSAHSSIPLAEELRFLRLFLSVERQRMGQERFSFSVDMDSRIDAEEVMVPPMILQPFAENSVWHGISLLTDRTGKVDIRVLAVPTGVDIVLEDNGIGRKQSEILKGKYRQKHKSSGLRITMERLELLNLERPLDQSFSVHIEDLHETDGTACGTRVTLHIPTNFFIFRA